MCVLYYYAGFNCVFNVVCFHPLFQKFIECMYSCSINLSSCDFVDFLFNFVEGRWIIHAHIYCKICLHADSFINKKHLILIKLIADVTLVVYIYVTKSFNFYKRREIFSVFRTFWICCCCLCIYFIDFCCGNQIYK